MKMLKKSKVLNSRTKKSVTELRSFFINMNSGQNSRMVNAFYKNRNNNPVSSLLQRRIQKISNKLMSVGFGLSDLTNQEWKELSTWQNLTIKRRNLTQASVKNSSWLLSVEYDMRGKMLTLHIIGYTKPYTFYNVPPWVFTALTVGNDTKGKLWWRKNFWKYSIGKRRNIGAR